jgi:hypothetical protein
LRGIQARSRMELCMKSLRIAPLDLLQGTKAARVQKSSHHGVLIA